MIFEADILKFIEEYPGYTFVGIHFVLQKYEEQELYRILIRLAKDKKIERKFESSSDGKEFGARYYPVKKKDSV